MNISYYKLTYDKAKAAIAELQLTRVSTTYFPPELSCGEAYILFRLLWALGVLLSEQPEDVKRALLDTPYGSLLKDGMADRGARLRYIIGELRRMGIALYSHKDLIDHPTLRWWYGDVRRNISNHVNKSLLKMMGKFDGNCLLRDFFITAAPIFNEGTATVLNPQKTNDIRSTRNDKQEYNNTTSH